MSGSRLLADSGLYRTVIQFSDTARHLVHILVYIEVIERRTVGRGGGNPDLLHSTLLIVLPHRLLLLQVQPSIYTEVKVIAVGGGRSRNRVSEQRNRSIYQSRYLWYLRYLLEVRARTELIPLKGTWYQAAVW